MKTLSQNEKSELLSRFVDGQVSDEERKTVEQLSASDNAVKQELQELWRLQTLLAASAKLKPDIGFATRLAAMLNDQRREEENLLPVPRKYFPGLIAVGSVAMLFIAIAFFPKRASMSRVFVLQSQAVKEVVDNNFMKSAILPLFTSVNRDQALQFALFGSVPIDDKNNASLNVDDQAERGYRIEVTKAKTPRRKTLTVEDLMAEVQPTRNQREAIDSILDLTRGRIQSSILFGDGDFVAVDPELPRLNKALVGNIASCLTEKQQTRFEKLLKLHNCTNLAHFTRTRAAQLPAMTRGLARASRSQQFMVITPETLVFANIAVDFDAISRQIEAQEQMRKVVLERRDRFIERALRAVATNDAPRGLPNLDEMPDIFRIDVQPNLDSPSAPLAKSVRPGVRGKPGFGGFHFQVTAGGAENQMMHIQVFNPSMTHSQMNSRGDSETVDPQILVRRLRIQRAKLDSLLRAIQE